MITYLYVWILGLTSFVNYKKSEGYYPVDPFIAAIYLFITLSVTVYFSIRGCIRIKQKKAHGIFEEFH